MLKTSSALAVALGLASLFAGALPAQADPVCSTNCFSKRWVYFSGNLSGEALTANPVYVKLLNLIQSAKQNGYNGIALDSSGSGVYATMLRPAGPYPNFYTNYQSIVQKAQEAGIELIPVGGGPEVPAFLDPTQVEALPVNNLPFQAGTGVATAIGNSIVTDSSFENADVRWGLLDKSSGAITYDNTVAHGTGGVSVKLTETSAAGALARLYRQFDNLQPHTAYRMSFWIKTSNYDAPLAVQIYDPETKSPIYYNRDGLMGWGTAADGTWNADRNIVGKNQEWQQYNLDFNTGNYSSIRLYMGTWKNGNSGGSAWIDDLDIREVGLAHTVRRASTPVKVTSDDGSVTYTENSDYVVKAEALTLPAQSRIQPGQKLKVSYYQSGLNMATRWNTPATSCNNYFVDTQKAYFDKVSDLFTLNNNKPTKYFLYYDEIRVMNWDPACPAQTAGTYFANQTRALQNTLTTAHPEVELYIWHDMFDPAANATSPYFAVNGDLSQSWDGLNPSTVIMNWTDTTTVGRTASLKFFGGRALKQMVALYYDDHSMGKVNSWMDALDAAQQQPNGVTGVDGIMYTTWVGDYSELANVANAIKARAPGRWPQ